MKRQREDKEKYLDVLSELHNSDKKADLIQVDQAMRTRLERLRTSKANTKEVAVFICGILSLPGQTKPGKGLTLSTSLLVDNP